MSYTAKQIRNLNKKAKKKEERYKETGNKDYLRERDSIHDQVNIIKRNMEVNLKNKKRKINQEKKSDLQLMNEAIKMNRSEKNEAEQKKKVQKKKEEERKERRKNVKGILKKKKEEIYEKEKKEKEDYQKYMESIYEEKQQFREKYLEHHPDSTDSKIQKEFVRSQKKKIEFLNWKESMVQCFQSVGMDKDEAEEEFYKMIKFNETNQKLELEDMNSNPRL